MPAPLTVLLPVALLLLAGCGADMRTPPSPSFDPTPAWGTFLGQIVTAEGLIDYELLRADPEPLADFVGYIAVHGPETDGYRLLDDNRRLAWHLNAYNALVLWGILEHWPLSSVHDVKGPLGTPSAFFWWPRFGVDNERMNLHRYEQNVILATYEEPLAHAALNCASRSCPPLRGELYRAKALENQLADQMRRWVASGSAVTMEGDPASGGRFVFNAIFDWYAEDFAIWAGATTPCQAIRPYAASADTAATVDTPNALTTALDVAPDCPHTFAPYDWRLNDARAAP